MKSKPLFRLSSVLMVVVLLLCLWAMQLTPVTAQSGSIHSDSDQSGSAESGSVELDSNQTGAVQPDSSIDEDSGHELPPEQRQALLELMGSAASEAPASVNQACTIGTWQTVSPVNTPRSRPALTYASFNGRFYLIGGEASGSNRDNPIEEYNPATDTWTDKAHLLTGVSNTGAAAIGQYIYIPGGYTGASGEAAMQRYNIVANTLTTLAPMTSTLYAHTVVALDNKVYALGGSETGAAGTTNRMYDVATNSWDAGAPLPVAVNYATAVTDGYYIFVIGGNSDDIATVQRYNPQTDTWTLIPDLAEGRGGAGGFFDGQNVWVAAGGWSTYLTTTEYWDGIRWQSGPAMSTGVRTTGAAFGDGLALKAAGWNGDFEDDAEILSIECAPPPPPPVCTIGEWQEVSPINTPRSRPSLAYAANRFYLIGGEASGGIRDIPIEEYNPATNTWTDKANLLIGVSNTDVAAVGNYLYIPGGYSGLSVADLQRYDIQSNTVVTMTAMPAENFAHAAVVHNNKLHVLGGSATGVPGFTHYVYDIATDSWSSAAPLLTAVNYPAASSDGQYIYVMGGNTDNYIGVQRYDPATDVWTEAPIMDIGRGGPGAFFDGQNIWAVGGGWYSYETSTEYFDGYRWRSGPEMNVGARTLGAAFGNGVALKAGGWNGTFVDSAEMLEITCQQFIYLPTILR
ncbi:MAG: hypothetical protein H6662_06595 [Ardenticatenaceae bacterium]|nr:hypothetical protein [Anaerolineales bacterium]MCB8921233.1 hypothetical protein [Ardenticatenaceae bacterium]MCB8990599.1 hypothetical protein [Ardenticatenaceae bacterium]MCB9004306.1 hypothetical protein [Ardenticatenaceae bacterium]